MVSGKGQLLNNGQNCSHFVLYSEVRLYTLSVKKSCPDPSKTILVEGHVYYADTLLNRHVSSLSVFCPSLVLS